MQTGFILTSIVYHFVPPWMFRVSYRHIDFNFNIGLFHFISIFFIPSFYFLLCFALKNFTKVKMYDISLYNARLHLGVAHQTILFLLIIVIQRLNIISTVLMSMCYFVDQSRCRDIYCICTYVCQVYRLPLYNNNNKINSDYFIRLNHTTNQCKENILLKRCKTT